MSKMEEYKICEIVAFISMQETKKIGFSYIFAPFVLFLPDYCFFRILFWRSKKKGNDFLFEEQIYKGQQKIMSIYHFQLWKNLFSF